MKKSNIYKGLTDPWMDEWGHKCAAWANNHMGWAKQKKANKKLAKKRLRREEEKEMKRELEGMD